MNGKGYRIQFTSAKIEDLMFRTTFDPRSGEGELIVNVSVINSEDFEDVLGIFKAAASGGLSLSPFLKVFHEGETIGDMKIEKGKIGFATVCSITIDGVLLKSGILVKPKFGGLVQIRNGSPVRFTDLLTYKSTTIDPLEVLMSQEATSVSRIMQKGSGKMLASLREIQMSARDEAESVLSDLVDAGISGIMDVGEPNTRILDVQVERDHLGVVVIGGTNPMAMVQEQGIPIKTHAMSTFMEFKELSLIDDII